MTTWQALVGDSEVDPRLAAALHDAANPRLTRRVAQLEEGGADVSFDDEMALAWDVIEEVLEAWRADAYTGGRPRLLEATEQALAHAVHHQIYGLGPIQPFVEDPQVTDISVNGCDTTWLTLRDGRKIAGPPAAESDDRLVEIVQRQARRVGRAERRWDRESVSLDLQLPDGSRLHALREVTGRPVVHIRRHNWDIAHLSQLISDDEVDCAIADFLATAVRARFNIVVSGGRAAGKTTLLRCLINEIPPSERIVTIEDSLELGIHRFADLHPDVISIEAREPNNEGKGAYTLAQGVRDSLRMGSGSDGRVMVGEVRGYEVLPMLKVMSQGKDGSMCTVHANNARNALQRFQVYALELDSPLPFEASAPLIAEAVDFVVHLAWDRGPRRRRVASIVEVSHAEGGVVHTNEVWKPDAVGRGLPGARLRDETADRLAEAGFDFEVLDKPHGWWHT